MVTTTAKLTPDEYRDREAIAEIRHEYRDGEIFEMPGGSIDHSSIITDLLLTLGLLLQDTDANLYVSDMRLWIPACNVATYPDVTVVTGDPVLNGNRTDEILNPTLIAEVLSPSTSGYDRGDKFAAYRTIPSFREYLLVRQDRPAIEHYWKIDENRWQLEEIHGLDAIAELHHLPAQLPLAKIYRRVQFEAG